MVVAVNRKSPWPAAVTVNHLKGDADPNLSATLAQVFVAARILHPVAYIGNIAATAEGDATRSRQVNKKGWARQDRLERRER